MKRLFILLTLLLMVTGCESPQEDFSQDYRLTHDEKENVVLDIDERMHVEYVTYLEDNQYRFAIKPDGHSPLLWLVPGELTDSPKYQDIKFEAIEEDIESSYIERLENVYENDKWKYHMVLHIAVADKN